MPLTQAKWYYYVILGLVDVEANFLGKCVTLLSIYIIKKCILSWFMNPSRQEYRSCVGQYNMGDAITI